MRLPQLSRWLWLAAVCLPVLPAFGAPEAPARAPGLVGFHVEPLPLLSAAQRAALGTTNEQGVVVALVVPGGPGEQAGLKLGDLLLRFAGQDVPQPTWTDRYVPQHHEWRVAVRTLLANVRAEEPVEVVVTRAGQPMTLTLRPISESAMHLLQGGRPEALPAPAEAGAPQPLSVGFEGAGPEALLPDAFLPWEGTWRVVAEEGVRPVNRVLRQERPVLPWATLLVTGQGRAYADASASVRFMPVSGVADASGGLVFRAQDGKNYYLVRANALEDNFGLYVLKNGVRSEVKSMRVVPPSAHAWHRLEVSFTGSTFRATLDGTDTLEAHDETYATGWCGLWTKADSVTLFDDFSVVPAGSVAPTHAAGTGAR